MLLKTMLSVAVAAGTFAAGTPAQATVLDVTGNAVPTITAGAPPDSPTVRIDANTSSSDFSGVVSINIRYGTQNYICSGALVGKRQIVSAGHCVDKDGNGKAIDLTNPDNKVLVVFNSNGTANAIIAATQVSMEPNYQGFSNCPDGRKGCVNDDIAVITLAKDAPETARIYKVSANPIAEGTHIIMAGYGTSGDGLNGFTVSPSYYVKRHGENYADFFAYDDEKKKGYDRPEVYYADFDGNGKDSFCTLVEVCSPILANGVEAGIGGGDSGGPSFIDVYGELVLVANNTFTSGLSGSAPGTFGTWFGGIVLGSYTDYLVQATGGNITFYVPEPGSLAMFGLGGLMLAGTRRRRKQ